MKRVRVFRYLPDVDAFDVTPEYRELAEELGLAEWNPVVWIGLAEAYPEEPFLREEYIEDLEERISRRQRGDEDG